MADVVGGSSARVEKSVHLYIHDLNCHELPVAVESGAEEVGGTAYLFFPPTTPHHAAPPVVLEVAAESPTVDK